MAGRPPKPTEYLELTGAFRKNPARRKARADEPKPPSPSVGPPPAKFDIFYPELGYQRAEKIRAVWDECAAMWPWLTFSDRHTLERYSILKVGEDARTLNNTEKRMIVSLCSRLGGDGAGRAQLGQRLLPGAAVPKTKTDPRVLYMETRKCG
jgi:hypothetical protein